jgi:hypothetical protein
LSLDITKSVLSVHNPDSEQKIRFYDALASYMKEVIKVKGINYYLDENNPCELSKFINMIVMDWNNFRIKDTLVQEWLHQIKINTN